MKKPRKFRFGGNTATFLGLKFDKTANTDGHEYRCSEVYDFQGLHLILTLYVMHDTSKDPRHGKKYNADVYFKIGEQGGPMSSLNKEDFFDNHEDVHKMLWVLIGRCLKHFQLYIPELEEMFNGKA